MDEIIKFIDDLKKIKKIEWGGGRQPDGTIQFPFPLYPFEIHKFEEVFFNSELVNRNYGERMTEKNWWEENVMEQDISTMTKEDVGTCITAIFRQERFCDGTIQRFLENGILFKLLEHLKNIASLA